MVWLESIKMSKFLLAKILHYTVFRNTDFNYLKYCNLRRKTDACMKLARILWLFLIYLSIINQLLNG